MDKDTNIDNLFLDTVACHEGMIRRICHVYSTEKVTNEDLYQEAMVALWNGLKSFKGKSSLSTWIYRVVINSCISFLRHNDSKTLYISTESIKEIPDSTTSYCKDDYECLTYLISRLSPLDKALILMWLDERTYKEISDVTGLAPNLVGTRLTRIRTKLRKLWKTEISNTFDDE